MKERKCLRCDVPMEPGELTSPLGLVAWVPDSRFQLDLKRVWSKSYRLVVFRCPKCNTLESTATPDE